MDDKAVSIEIDGIPCVFHGDFLNSPVMLHKLAKVKRSSADGVTAADITDVDFIAERIFGEEQWEAILWQIDGKGIAYMVEFVGKAFASASSKDEDVKNS